MNRGISFVALLVGLLAAYAASANEVGLAKVIAVIDGDTVLLMPIAAAAYPAYYKLRLADIDAPEKDQVFGPQAQQALTQLALDQQVRVRTVATDSYGRYIGWITLEQGPHAGTVVNTDLVRRGWAWALSRSRSPELREAQQQARFEKRGLWAESDALPPWIWRRQKRDEGHE